MLRVISCLLLFGTLCFPAVAQTVPPPALGAAAADSGAVLVLTNWYLPAYRATATSGADTTGALVSLFRKRRYAGFLYTIPFITGVSLALPLSSTDQYGRQHVASEAISPPLGSLILAGTVAGFIAHASRYTKQRLVAIDRAYAAGQPIPARYRRLLRDQHFAEAALLREAIAQQRAREQVGSPPSR